MPKKAPMPIVPRGRSIAAQSPDQLLPYKRKIQELEQQLQNIKEEELLRNEITFRREILLGMNRIAEALEGNANQVGDEEAEAEADPNDPYAGYEPIKPSTEPEQAGENDF